MEGVAIALIIEWHEVHHEQVVRRWIHASHPDLEGREHASEDAGPATCEEISSFRGRKGGKAIVHQSSDGRSRQGNALPSPVLVICLPDKTGRRLGMQSGLRT